MASNANSFDNTVDDWFGFLKNERATAIISLFLILYAVIIAPRLSPRVLRWFNNWIVQVALFFAIVYISGRNVTVALIAAIAVLVTLMIANNQMTLRKILRNPGRYNNNVNTRENMYLENDGFGYRGNDGALYNIKDTDERDNATNCGCSSSDDVEGIMDEDVEEIDISRAGMNHAVHGSAITSVGGPHTKNINLHLEDVKKVDITISGIEHTLDEDDAEASGSSLDESVSLGSDHAKANHVDNINYNK
jgi:hypothetical protein